MNTGPQKLQTVNPNDFIWIDAQANAFRVRRTSGEHWLYRFQPDKKWVSVRALRIGEMVEMAQRAVPHPCCLRYEHGVPFLPMPQQQMFDLLGPCYENCLITTERGQIRESQLVKHVSIGNPVLVTCYFWGNVTGRSVFWACTFFLN